MTHTLTRDEIEQWIKEFKLDTGCSWYPLPTSLLTEAFTLARERLDMEPRPLSELPTEEPVLGYKGDRVIGIHIYNSVRGLWLASSDAMYSHMTHGIPLSALPKVKP